MPGPCLFLSAAPTAPHYTRLSGGAGFDGFQVRLDLRLARYFGLSEGFFLGLQSDHDPMKRRRRIEEALDKIGLSRHAARPARLLSFGEQQRLDNLAPVEKRRYMHHYNFPPFSVGETRPLRGTNYRRENTQSRGRRARRPRERRRHIALRGHRAAGDGVY